MKKNVNMMLLRTGKAITSSSHEYMGEVFQLAELVTPNYRQTLQLYMKAFIGFVLLFIFAGGGTSSAQTLRAELSISPHPSQRISDWQSRRETATLLIFNTSDKNIDVKIDARLSLNGSLIAQTKIAQMPVLSIPPGGPAIYYAGDLFPENAISFTGDQKQTTARTGMLPEGNYELCITLVSVQNFQPLAQASCRTFSLQKNILPVLLAPEDNNKVISGMEKTTLFVWTPLLPVSSTPVTYRLRVVEVLTGQNAQQAFLNNIPLFERTVINATQYLWPQEIPAPPTGAMLAWGIQPEDDQGNPLVLPERFTNPFTLIILPTREECDKLLGKIKKLHENGLKVEEEYWQADAKFQRTSQLTEEAEERADALEIEKWKSQMKSAEKKLEKIKTTFDAAREKYDVAITEYENCGK